MEFLRRIYYDLSTGDVILNYNQCGSVHNLSIEEEMNVHPQLSNRTLEDTGCMEWTTPVLEIEARIVNGSHRVSVDVSVTPHALVFTEIEIDPQDDPIEDRVDALEQALAQTDETAIELFEMQLAQDEINAAQDDALIELYELIGG